LAHSVYVGYTTVFR